MDIVEKIILLQDAGLLTGAGVANEQDGVFTQFDFTPPFTTVAELDQFITDNQAAVDTHVADKAAEKAAKMSDRNTKFAGFDYNGTMISYTAKDRSTVTNTDAAFEKMIGGSPLIADGTVLRLNFDNGSELEINKTDFNATFLPAFYAVAGLEFIV